MPVLYHIMGEIAGKFPSKGRFYKGLIVFLFSFFITIPPAFAIGNIHLGLLKIHPYFILKEGFLSNPSLSPKGKEQQPSGYSSLTSGVKCDWTKTKYEVKLDYFYELFDYYTGVQDKKYYEFDTRYILRFGKLGRKLDFHGGYSYSRTTDPSTDIGIEDRKETNINTGVTIQMKGRFSFLIDPVFTNYRYLNTASSSGRNRDITGIVFTPRLRLLTKTIILLTYGYYDTKYEKPNESRRGNSSSQSFLAGASWDVTEKTSGSIKLGYQVKEYKHSGYCPETWNLIVDLKQNLSDFTFLTLKMSRRIEDYFFTGEKEDFNYYYLNNIGLSIDNRLTYKIGAWIDISFVYYEFNHKPRIDKIWEFDAGLSYQFLEWILAQVSLHAKAKSTNEDKTPLNYENFEINLGILFNF